MEPVNIAILGLGTVGEGTFRVLQRNCEEISRRAGRQLNIYGASVKDLNKTRQCDTSQIKVTTDPFEFLQDPNVDIVVELIGGCTFSKDVIMAAIAQKKHVVTANKALIAEHGNEIFKLAEQHGVTVAFEGAVAGGIPIIKTIREGLGGNRIDWIAGIINGTSNYILTQMRDNHLDFQTALSQAQEKGYAEADPSFDINGTDAAHKLSILGSLAFGIPLQFDKVNIEGISHIEQIDIQFTKQLGFDIKHLGIAKRAAQGIELRVQPALIAKGSLLAQVNGVMNAVAVHANAVGTTLYYGPGAGGEPTASSVIADLVDIVRNINLPSKARVPYLAFQSDAITNIPIVPIDKIISAYYLRLNVVDEPGILAKVTDKLSAHEVSIKSLIQPPLETGSKKVPVLVLTHPILEGELLSALEEIKQCHGIDQNIVKLRIEDVP